MFRFKYQINLYIIKESTSKMRRHQQRRDRGIVNNTVNQRIVYRGTPREEISTYNQPNHNNQHLETVTSSDLQRQNIQINQPNPPQDPDESDSSGQQGDSSSGWMTEMSQFGQEAYQQSLDIQNFILQNTIGERPKYRMPKRNIKIDDRFRSKSKYQYALRELVKLEIVSGINRRIQEKDQEAYQREIKVKLTSHLIYNPREQDYERIIVLKASNIRNYYYLEQILIKGKRLGIITRSLPFKTQNLTSKAYQTRLCFIWKDVKSKNILVKGLQQIQISNSEQDSRHYYNEKIEEQQKLRPGQYYFMDLDSIITSVRQYRAVCDSLSFPLIDQIIGKKSIRGQAEQQKLRLNYMNSSHIYNKIKRQRNKSQLEAIKNIFKRDAGIYLIQGPPGTGKTQSIVNFTSLQQHYFSKGQQDQCNTIMICAQSNAAVNHIGRKILTDRLIGRNDLPQILRLGYTQQFDQLLLSINLPHLCQIRLRKTQDNKNDWSAKLRWQKTLLQDKINRMMKQGYERSEINRQKDQLYYKIKRIVQIYQDLQQKKKQYEQIQQEYMKKSRIVLTTLNTSGKKKFADFYRYRIRCLIIDEASQASEPSTLIPFNTQVEKVILVGDHMQLQPTIMSSNCRFTKFNRSLFERLATINHIPYLLDVQYRMVLTLQQFPSRQFYENKLKLGKNIIVPYSLRQLSSSSMFFNVTYGAEQKLKKSYQNEAQAYCVSILIGRLMYYDSNLKIGVIAPYRSQIKYLENQIMYEVPMSDQERDNIRISTVDAFQGQEMDVIIISCVRSNQQQSIGFVRDEKRMNVAITRAKYALFVFGNAETLRIDSTWSNYIAHHRNKSSFFDINSQKQCDPRLRSLVRLQRQDQYN